MLWWRRWNFIERARLERELWDAYERREDIDALVEALRRDVQSPPSGGPAEANPEGVFRLEVWDTTLRRIRRIETLMRDKRPSGPEP